jgi:hypothetical protein
MELALSSSPDALAEQLARDVDAALRKALVRFLGTDEAVDQALADGACWLSGGTLAWRFNPELLMVELFCDIGLPEPAYTQDAYRYALEVNLCRTYPGVWVGLHPDSQRLVATVSVPAVLMLDETVCVPTLEGLAGHAQSLRAQPQLRLQDLQVPQTAQAPA